MKSRFIPNNMVKATDIPYVKEALEYKKWAFVFNVIRLYTLYEYGGIYLDADVFLKNRIDVLLTDDFVSTMEYHAHIVNLSATDADGTLDVSMVVPIHYAINAERYGFRCLDIEQILESMTFHRSYCVAWNMAEDNKHALTVHYCDIAERIGQQDGKN